MLRFLRFAYAATSCAAIILLLTLGTFSLYPWVRAYGYQPESFLQMLALFPVIVALVAQVWPSPRRGSPPFAAGAAGAAIGLVYGYVAPRVVMARRLLSMGGYWNWRILGPIRWEIDLTLVVFAIVAGTCALLLSITARSRPVIATVAILILISVLVPVPTFDLVNHNQELTVAVVIPYTLGGGNEPRVISTARSTPVDVSSVTSHVQGLLRDEGIAGHYRVSNLWRGGHGKQALAVIVLNQPVVSKVEFKQPRGGNVIYLQQPDGWKQIPPHLPTLDRSLTLKPLDDKEALGSLMISEGGGYFIGFGIWKTND